jgi:hypothetical protein
VKFAINILLVILFIPLWLPLAVGRIAWAMAVGFSTVVAEMLDE